MASKIVDARTFLLAIKESAGNWLDPLQFDAEAVEYLELISERMFAQLDALHIPGRDRDRLIYFDAMLKGVILKLRKNVVQGGTELRDQNLLTPDGKVKEN